MKSLQNLVQYRYTLAGDIPDKVDKVLFAWERGTKLFVTNAEKVNTNTRAAFFKQYLRQKATIYVESNNVLPKEYSFKIQSVKAGSGGEDHRKTLGKVKVDLAQYCDGQVNPAPQDVFFKCEPVGKIKVSIKATWLKDERVDPDAMTELTEMTDWTETSFTAKSRKSRKQPQQRHDGEGGEGDEGPPQEQDLSGFDAYQEGEGDEGDPSERRGKKGKKKKHRRRLDEEMPEVAEDKEAEAQYQQDEARGGGEGGQQPKIKAALADEIEIELGARIHKTTWRDYLCCCCPPHADMMVQGNGHGAVDPHEQDGLLDDKQAEALDIHNDHTPMGQKKKRKKKKKRPEDEEVGPGESEL